MEVRDLSPGPIAVGSTYTVVERSRFGSDAMRIEVTAYEPPKRYQNRATASMFTGTLTVTLAPEGQGTRVTLTEEFSARGPGKLLEGIFARSGQKRIAQGLERLKAMAERGGA